MAVTMSWLPWAGDRPELEEKRCGSMVEGGGAVPSGRGWETAKPSTSPWKSLLLDQLSSLPTPLYSNILETTEAFLTLPPSLLLLLHFTLSPQQMCFYWAHGFLSPIPGELPMSIILSYTWAVTLPRAEAHLPNSQWKKSKWGPESCSSSRLPSDAAADTASSRTPLSEPLT